MLNLNQNKNILASLTVLIAAVILFWTITSAVSSGKNIAQAEIVTSNAQALTKALEYFYNDQERFPTAGEFIDKNSMGTYLSVFPILDIVSETCPQSYLYKRPNSMSYELNFCLPKKQANYNAGWNKFLIKK
jgi:hypothetical protein